MSLFIDDPGVLYLSPGTGSGTAAGSVLAAEVVEAVDLVGEISEEVSEVQTTEIVATPDVVVSDTAEDVVVTDALVDEVVADALCDC